MANDARASDGRYEVRFAVPAKGSLFKAELSRNAGLALGKIFSVLKEELGLNVARELFARFAPPTPKKRGRPPLPERKKQRLLDLSDMGFSISEIAIRMHESGGFGNSQEAVEKQVQRVRKAAKEKVGGRKSLKRR